MLRFGRFLVLTVLVLCAAVRPASTSAQEKPEPYTIVVLGDSLAAGVGEGLMHVLKNDARFRILRRAKPATGFSRYDQFNWQDRLVDVAAAERIDIAVILMGTNDRQAVFLDSFRSVPFGTDEWTRIYRERAEAFVDHLTQRNVWVIWVGLPAMQNRNFDKGMRQIDGIYKGLAERRCLSYVSLFERTVDADGKFAASGADAHGRQRVLRAPDGIHFTLAGYDLAAKVVADAMRADVVGCDRTVASP